MFRSHWVLALLPAILVGMLISPPASRYVLTTAQQHNQFSLTSFEDLDSDGQSEFLFAKKDEPFSTVGVQTLSGQWHDQWNIHSRLFPEISQFYFGDYDHDSRREIYLFTVKGDSLLLNVNEFFDSTGLVLEGRYLARLGLVEGVILHNNVLFVGFYDQNHDGADELYIEVTSGLGLYPRQLYAIDLKRGITKSTAYTGVQLVSPFMADVNHDGVPEILGSSSASGNQHEPTTYSDYSCWLMMYNADLELQFPPVEFPGFSGKLHVEAYQTHSTTKLLTTFHGNEKDTVLSTIALYDHTGTLLRQQSIREFEGAEQANAIVAQRPDGHAIILLSNPMHVLDSALRSREEIQSLPFLIPGYASPLLRDLDQDDWDDFIFYSNDDHALYFVSNQLENIGSITGVPAVDYGLTLTGIHDREKIQFLLSGFDYAGYLFSVRADPHYALGYLRYPLLYLGVVLFVALVQRITRLQVERREKARRRIQDLQLRSIKGQLDPHFTFNALTAIGSMLQLEDRNIAYDYLSKFTKLLRQLMADAERIWRPLQEELDFVTAYLDLEKMRFEGKFDYVIAKSDGVTGHELVPVMCIQIFVENAIRHGLMHLKTGGLVTVEVTSAGGRLRIVITDNGIGRQRAATLNPRQGKGLRMTRELYEILNQSRKEPITFTITDLPAGGGTKVEVVV